MDELKHLLRLQQVAQLVFSQIAKLGLRWEGAAGQLLHRLRQEDLASVTGSEEPR